MQVLGTIVDFGRARRQLVGTLGLVPTMGALHEGHLALVRRARAENDFLAVSIFVNPSQFGRDEDLAAYPRDMPRDLSLLDAEGVDTVFAPRAEEMFPPGFDSWVDVGALSQRLEGEHRPGHFRGVTTVVAKLFNIVRPDRAYFGQKDGQQATVIKRMVTDFAMGVDMVVVPTVRESDGLALSSRNAYLTPEQRAAGAPVVYAALSRAQHLWEAGERDGDTLRREVRSVLDGEPRIKEIDYVSVADSSTLEEVDAVRGPVMVSTAVRIGSTRLIDNLPLG